MKLRDFEVWCGPPAVLCLLHHSRVDFIHDDGNGQTRLTTRPNSSAVLRGMLCHPSEIIY